MLHSNLLWVSCEQLLKIYGLNLLLTRTCSGISTTFPAINVWVLHLYCIEEKKEWDGREAFGIRCSLNHDSKRFVLIHPFWPNPYCVPVTSPFVQEGLSVLALKTTKGGIACPTALAQATMVIWPFFPEHRYRTFFVYHPLGETILRDQGFNVIPVSSTLYIWAGRLTKLWTSSVSFKRAK